MIIFGTRGVKSDRERGVFFCPNCQMRRNYKLVEQRRYGHLFFIPLLPLDTVGSYVECEVCHTTYRPEVLDYDPDRLREKLIEDYSVALLRTMCCVAAADGRQSPYEIGTIRNLYAELTKNVLNDDQVAYLISVADHNAATLVQELERLAGNLNDQAKEALVQANVLVALCDGDASEAEFQVIVSYAQALGMSRAHFQGVLAAAREQFSR